MRLSVLLAVVFSLSLTAGCATYGSQRAAAPAAHDHAHADADHDHAQHDTFSTYMEDGRIWVFETGSKAHDKAFSRLVNLPKA